MDVEAANQAIQDGSLQWTMQAVTERIHPEAVYFTAEGGKRTAYLIFDLADSSQIPEIAEPFFHTLRAEVDFKPVMNSEELAKGLQTWEAKRAA